MQAGSDGVGHMAAEMPGRLPATVHESNALVRVAGGGHGRGLLSSETAHRLDHLFVARSERGRAIGRERP